MKKIIVGIFLALLLAGCGGDKQDEAETPPPAEQSQDDSTETGSGDDSGQEPGGGDTGGEDTDPGTGEEGEEGGEEVTPEPENTAPVANAGSAQNVRRGTVVTLDGSASSDPDGDTITYDWSLTAPEGSAAALEGADTTVPTFLADIAGDYTAELVVNDGQADSEAAVVTITVLEPKRVAFIGGSITAGAGSTKGNSWAEKTARWLDGYWPQGADTKNIAIGGTTSQYGVYRLQRDLAGFVPDLAFIEYVMNDPVEQSFIHANVDALVYKLRAINPEVLLVYVATTGTRHETERRAGLEPDAVRLAREIATLNGLGFVDVGAALWQQIIADNADPADYLPDGVHPSNAGYAVYFTALQAALADYLPDAQPLGMADSYLHGSGLGGAWIAPPDLISDTNCPTEGEYLQCAEGGRFSLVFYGAAVGFDMRIASDGGQLACTMDGVAGTTVNFWDQYALSFDRTGGRLVYSNLTENWHLLECQVTGVLLQNTAGSSTGHTTRIKGVLLSHPQ